MDHIRLIASDMDATLLDERSQLPPDFAETIRALAGQGILFAAASGRPLYTLETMFPELLEEIILIGDNGGAARWKGKDLFVSEMPAEGWRQLARSTKQAGDVGLLCGLQAAYAEKRDEGYDAVFKNFYTRVEYVDDLTAVEAAADKFTIYLPNDDAQKAFDRTYGAFHTGNGGAFSVAVAGRNWVDVMNPCLLYTSHKVGVGFNEAAVRHGAADPLGKINGVLMLCGKGIRRVFLCLVRVGHIVDAKAHHVLRGAGDGALQLYGIDGQSRDACNGKLQPGPHLRGQKGNGVGQGFIGKAQPAQGPDLCAVGRKNGRILYAVRQTACNKTHTDSLPQWR